MSTLEKLAEAGVQEGSASANVAHVAMEGAFSAIVKTIFALSSGAIVYVVHVLVQMKASDPAGDLSPLVVSLVLFSVSFIFGFVAMIHRYQANRYFMRAKWSERSLGGKLFLSSAAYKGELIKETAQGTVRLTGKDMPASKIILDGNKATEALEEKSEGHNRNSITFAICHMIVFMVGLGLFVFSLLEYGWG